MSVTFNIVYEDGSTVAARVKPRHQVRYQDLFGAEPEETARAGFALAWVASEATDDLDGWLQQVAEVTSVADDDTGGLAAVAFEVEYEDGSTLVHRLKPRHLVKYQQEFGVEPELNARNGFALAWIASESAQTFDSWITTVEDIRERVGQATADAVLAGDGDGGGGQVVPT